MRCFATCRPSGRTSTKAPTPGARDVIGHLIHGERTDWIVRAHLILSDAADKTFVPFDRFAQFSMDQAEPIELRLATGRDAARIKPEGARGAQPDRTRSGQDG